MSTVNTKASGRTAQHAVDSRILQRWSPRALSGEPITKEQLLSLFEAARWAPSCYNNQPWRFIYAQRDTPAWQSFLDLLVPFNQSWAHNAAALVIIASKKNFTFNNKPSRTHAFDTGAAWQNLALQASVNGLVAHGMEGFDYEKAAQLINLPDDWEIHAMCAIGKPGEIEQLPPDVQKKETPSDRNPIESFIFEGLVK
jgi:nitroreductase